MKDNLRKMIESDMARMSIVKVACQHGKVAEFCEQCRNAVVSKIISHLGRDL
jgi:hypothetical protein